MFRHLPCLMLSLFLLPNATAENFALVENGAAHVSIVVEAKASKLVQKAAEDLQHYVQLRTGVSLPLHLDGKTLASSAIYVGHCESTPKEALPPHDANPESFRIHLADGNLYLLGLHPPATSFATVSFIEESLGVRWFAPGSLWEYVPEATPGALSVEVESRLLVPDWSPRIWSGHQWIASWKEWNERNKTLCIPPVPFRNMQNHLHKIFDPKIYAETHPEYYPLIKGERWIPPKGYRNWRPCTSNPEVLQITVEAARSYFDAHPEHNSFSLAMDDIYALCACDACRAMDAQPDDYEKKRFSNRHYRFVNRVAKEVAKTHPDKYIGTLCYHIARELPENVQQLEPNVFISMTQRVGEWWRPNRREDDKALTQAWRKRCQHMSRYGYMGLGFVTPRIFPHAMAEGMKFDHELAFEGVYNECYVILPSAAPMMWMMAKLQWNTDLDADALLDEFYHHMFGDAASFMKAYFELLEKSYMQARPERLEAARWGHRHLKTHALVLSLEDLQRAEELLQKAPAKSDDPQVKARIDCVAGALNFASYIIRAHAWAQELSTAPLATRAEAQAVLDKVIAFQTLAEQREQAWAQALARKDILGESLRGLQRKGYFAINQIESVESPVTDALYAALDTLHDSAPGEAYAYVKKLSKDKTSSIADKAQAWMLMKRADLPNLLNNPGFEDWQGETMDRPVAWTLWHNGARDKTAFLGVPHRGKKLSKAAAICEADSACFLQSIPVQEGQRYFCGVYAKPYDKTLPTQAALLIRWRDASGAWLEKRDLEPEAGITASDRRWRRISLCCQVPAGAAELVFMLKSTQQKEGAGILFDEALLSRLEKN